MRRLDDLWTGFNSDSEGEIGDAKMSTIELLLQRDKQVQQVQRMTKIISSIPTPPSLLLPSVVCLTSLVFWTYHRFSLFAGYQKQNLWKIIAEFVADSYIPGIPLLHNTEKQHKNIKLYLASSCIKVLSLITTTTI